jgi:NAD(P)-dependent dehydrogenase (short-subunit alcohol dehydrogenase family)
LVERPEIDVETVYVLFPESVIKLAEDVKAKFGTVDVLVNTQGLNYYT